MSNTILEIKLNGGLCNKLFHLFSACDIAKKNNIKILEPNFGWTRKILFSDIYDIDFFNEEMKKNNNGEIIMIPLNRKQKYNIKKNNDNLWSYSEKILAVQRKKNKLNADCMNIAVLKSLKLNKSNEDILKSFIGIEKLNALHIRIENDWIQYAKKNKCKSNQLLLIDVDTLINLYKDKWSLDDVFFTTGENQNNIVKKFTENNIKSQFMFNNKLEYEINAAINFELCCQAKIFIGLTNSTFSNLISLKRNLINKNNSFIYNLKGKIKVRVDKGLHFNPEDATNKNVEIL